MKKHPLFASVSTSVANVHVARPPKRVRRRRNTSQAFSLVPCSYSCRRDNRGTTLVVGEARRDRHLFVTL